MSPSARSTPRCRRELRRWLLEIHNKTGHTTVFVTHDQEEALELADRVVVMSEGKIEQIGTPDEIYDEPNSPFVFSFIGESSVASGSPGKTARSGSIRGRSICRKATFPPARRSFSCVRTTSRSWWIRNAPYGGRFRRIGGMKVPGASSCRLEQKAAASKSKFPPISGWSLREKSPFCRAAIAYTRRLPQA